MTVLEQCRRMDRSHDSLRWESCFWAHYLVTSLHLLVVVVLAAAEADLKVLVLLKHEEVEMLHQVEMDRLPCSYLDPALLVLVQVPVPVLSLGHGIRQPYSLASH